MVNKNRVGLFFAVAYGLCHLLWLIVVAAGWGQKLVDLALTKHFVSVALTVGSFDAMTALYGLVAALVVGFIDGFILAALWNWIVAKKK